MLAGLAGPRDIILMDADSHSSIYDGCRLSGATVVRFRHNDPDDLDRRLGRLQDQGDCKLIVVEGIYSMLGDRAPVGGVCRDQAAAWSLSSGRRGPFARCAGRARARRGRGAGHRGRCRLRCRDLQQEPGRGWRLWSIGSSEVRRPPLLQPALHVHRVVVPIERRLGAVGFSPDGTPTGTAPTSLGQRQSALSKGLTAAGFDICAPMSPIIAVRLPDERSCGLGLEPAARERGLCQPRTATGYPERGLPPALQRVRRAYAGADRRGLPALCQGGCRAERRTAGRGDPRAPGLRA